MKVNRKKLEIAEARACMGQKEVAAAGFSVATLISVKSGKNVTPKNSRKTCQNSWS